ncbi:MAG TPA: 5-formyltetrahydrofolate cyclo-ligase [Verrucomicrobiae bacterium]|nr:5-formyltetrahydrofolate cyclo-ligase [Verrucomicrobiae bacterium]
MNAEKQQLRQQMRAEAERHAAKERAACSFQICERIRSLDAWQDARSVLLFVPTVHEPDISPLMNEGKRVSLPKFNAQLGQYDAREVLGELARGQFGILEPSADCPVTKALDLILAPGVAFTWDGRRLGRGKGYYDRLLAQLKAVKIGVCFDWQIVPAMPRDVHDVLMDYIITPTSFQ